MEEAPTGLRERKKLRTRNAIVEAAMELFAERGFDEVTVAEIAAAAEVSPRTFFAYFPSKEDVVFPEFESKCEAMRARLEDRPEGQSAVDALRSLLNAALAEDHEEEGDLERLRHRLIDESPALAAHRRDLSGRFEEMLAEALIADLGGGPDDSRARFVAAAATAAIRALEEWYRSSEWPPDPVEGRAVLDEALAFLEGGISGLRALDRG